MIEELIFDEIFIIELRKNEVIILMNRANRK